MMGISSVNFDFSFCEEVSMPSWISGKIDRTFRNDDKFKINLSCIHGDKFTKIFEYKKLGVSDLVQVQTSSQEDYDTKQKKEPAETIFIGESPTDQNLGKDDRGSGVRDITRTQKKDHEEIYLKGNSNHARILRFDTRQDYELWLAEKGN